jgi:porin
MSNTFGILLSLALFLRMVATPALAFEVNERLSIGGVLAGAIQCQDLSDAPGAGSSCEGAVPLQTEFSYRPGEADEVFVKLGFAAGDGLNGDSPFVIAPWAADLEDDVKDVNARGRDHLLAAWYKHTFSVSEDNSLGASLGVIDATDYLDENSYANDEYTQFMNPALTNGPNVFLPSYDLGAALQWDAGRWSVRAVWMDVGENDDGNEFSFYGLQAGYSVDNSFGAGHYRVVFAGASRDFLDPAGARLEHRAGALLSFDQEFGAVVGGWIRVGWQTDEAAIDYSAIYSGGIDIGGSAWGRDGDNIGLGFAHLDGGSLDIDRSQVAEAYYRWQLREGLGLTADIQYQNDDYETGQGPSGWTFGLRAAAEF